MDENTTPDSTEPTTETTTTAAETAEKGEDMGKKIMDGAKEIFGNMKDAAVDTAEKIMKKDLDGDGKIGE